MAAYPRILDFPSALLQISNLVPPWSENMLHRTRISFKCSDFYFMPRVDSPPWYTVGVRWQRTLIPLLLGEVYYCG